MDRVKNSELSSTPIPKIIYQTWKSETLPEKLKPYRDAWMTLHPEPEWRFPLLLDADLRKLVEDHFPHHLPKYDSFTHTIERVDFARYIMMYLGGVYADIDTYPVQSIEPFLGYRIVLGTEPVEHATLLYGRAMVLCNAFMMSAPGEKIWIDFMDYIVENYEYCSNPVHTTGPMAMTKFYEANKEQFHRDGVLITDPCVFFPMNATGNISERCNLTKDTYVVHVWENSWVLSWWQNPIIFNPRYWFWILLFIFGGLWLYLYFLPSARVQRIR